MKKLYVEASRIIKNNLGNLLILVGIILFIAFSKAIFG